MSDELYKQVVSSTASKIATRLRDEGREFPVALQTHVQEKLLRVSATYGEVLAKKLAGQDVSKELAHIEAQFLNWGWVGAKNTADRVRQVAHDVLVEVGAGVKALAAGLLR